MIWLHGGGEGGLDVSITLLGNEVVSLIRPEIQSHFTTEGGAGGAYVLSVQCPTMWMGTSKGFGHGEYPSLYADVLKSCIDDYVDRHPDVDRKRIYLGGCSNGGYMTMHMLIRNPRYFAAAYPTCEAYLDANISDNEIKALAEENIWIVQSYDDTTVDPKTHCIPTFQRMMKAGAKNVWMSMFENVQGIDNPGQPLMGHFSWCYLFNDAVTMSQEQSAGDVKPSNDGGGSVAPQGHANIFEWMNAQVLTDPEPAPQPQRGRGAPARAQKSRIVEEGGSGPFKAIMMEEASLPTHTLFRPQDLSKFGKDHPLPVVVWGNGGCANSPSGHVNFLNEVASQGYLIVAIGPSNYQHGLDVRLMMSVDMVGWYKADNRLTLEGVSTIRNGRKILRSEKLNLKFKDFETSVLTATDTEGFAERQIPTIAATTGLKSPYHKPEDDAELIDYDGLDKVSDYLSDVTVRAASEAGFAPSGRVARKHRDGQPILEAGLAFVIGSNSLEFPKAAFDGKPGFTYGGGLSAQLNFGRHSQIGLKADALYLQTKALYPDETNLYASSLKYKGSELRVPVRLIFQEGESERFFVGFGGYYGHRFKSSLPVSQTIRKDDYGLSADVGIKVGRIGMSGIWMASLSPLFEGDTPSARQYTGLFKLSFDF